MIRRAALAAALGLAACGAPQPTPAQSTLQATTPDVEQPQAQAATPAPTPTESPAPAASATPAPSSTPQPVPTPTATPGPVPSPTPTPPGLTGLYTEDANGALVGDGCPGYCAAQLAAGATFSVVPDAANPNGWDMHRPGQRYALYGEGPAPSFTYSFDDTGPYDSCGIVSRDYTWQVAPDATGTGFVETFTNMLHATCESGHPTECPCTYAVHGTRVALDANQL